MHKLIIKSQFFVNTSGARLRKSEADNGSRDFLVYGWWSKCICVVVAEFLMALTN